MKCSTARIFFDQMFIEGERFDNTAVYSHIQNCTQCSHAYIRWCSIARKLSEAPSPEVPPTLSTRVMREIDDYAAHVHHHKPWLIVPQWNVFNIPAVFTVLLLVVVGIIMLLRNSADNKYTSPISSPDQSTTQTNKENNPVMVHFEYPHTTAQKVTLVGDFNGWNTTMHQMIKISEDTWILDIPIPKGCYQYLFYIDENKWEIDPNGKETIPDGFGGYNTVIEL